jgi:hypothetical protein
MIRRWLLRGLIGLVALYACLLVGLFFFGRALIYHPDPAVIALGANDPAGIEDIRIETPDGQTLRAWWMAPEPGKPVFLYFDGNGGRLHLQGYRFAKVAEQGAGMLAVAYRGYAGSTGSPSEAALHADARVAYNWLRTKVDAERIVIHGFSLGTGVAVRLAAQAPARALIMEAPYTAIVDLAAANVRLVPVRLIMQDRFLSRDWIGKVRTPLLIVHGDADEVIPIAHAERMFALAREPKALVRVPGGGHSTLVSDGLYHHVWTFLRMAPMETEDGG